MTETKSHDVIIAGGGFVGTTLALALATLAPKGFRVALIDAEPPQKDKADARASALSASSKCLLSVLGTSPELAGDAQPITSIDITDRSLDAQLRPHFLEFSDDLRPGESGAYMIENADLTRALSTALAREPAIAVFAPDSVTGFSATPFDIQVQRANSGAAPGKLLIPAPGQRSRLRDAAHPKCVRVTCPQVGSATTVH